MNFKQILLLLTIGIAFDATAQKISLEKVWETPKDLKTCESVLADPNGSRYFVSCINGNPTDKDSNGYISVISTTGQVVNKFWAQGVSAPKGMGISGELLYVTDIDQVVAFNLTTGKKIKVIPVEGAKFLNDIAVDKKGNVYVSDMLAGTVLKIVGDKAEALLQGSSIQQPNGLYAKNDGLRVVDMATGKLYTLAYDGKKLTEHNLNAELKGGDGIVEPADGKGALIISCWQGKIYSVEGKVGKKEKPGAVSLLLDTEAAKDNTADIGYDPVKNLVLVPTFFGDRVTAYKVVVTEK